MKMMGSLCVIIEENNNQKFDFTDSMKFEHTESMR